MRKGYKRARSRCGAGAPGRSKAVSLVAAGMGGQVAGNGRHAPKSFILYLRQVNLHLFITFAEYLKQ
jgi:hypothetical protein